MKQNYKYKAFISYAHKDKLFAKWLHKRVENYRLPRALNKKYPLLQNSLQRAIFLDEEELSGASSLSTVLKQALDESEWLIVVCSKYSVASQWVEAEIAYFKERHGEEKILYLLKGAVLEEVFPKGLSQEPLAIDVQKNSKMALVKTVASLLEIDFAELWQREVRASFWRIFWRGLLVMLFLLMGFYLYMQSRAISSNSELEQIERQIVKLEKELKQEGLSQNSRYILAERLKHLEESRELKEETLKWFGLLKTSLSEKAKEVYDKEGAKRALRVLDSFESQQEDKVYAKKNMLRAKLYIETGTFEEAEKAYEKAIVLEESYENLYDYALFLMKQNRPKRAKNFLERLEKKQLSKAQRANVLNRLGIVCRIGKEFARAKEYYLQALELRKVLSQKEPQKYQVDLAWTYNNLGILYKYEKRFKEAEKFHFKALALRQDLMQKNAETYGYYVSCSLHNIGELYSHEHDEKRAEHYLKRVLKMRRELFKENPERLMHPLAWTLHELAIVYSRVGREAEAEKLFKESLDLRRKLFKVNADAYRPVLIESLTALMALYEKKREKRSVEELCDDLKSLGVKCAT